MNTHFSYSLASRSGTDRYLRGWVTATAGALSLALVVTDAAAILATSLGTGLGFHELFHGEVGEVSTYLQIGALTATTFILANFLRGEYRLTSFLAPGPHLSRAFQVWNMTFVALLAIGYLAKESVVFSRGWMVLFYVAGAVAVCLMRLVAVNAVSGASQAGFIGTKRIYLVGSGREVEEFARHYKPWQAGVRIVGCRFLTPASEDASPASRRELLQADLAEAVRSARRLEPDAVFILASWSDPEAVEQCVETMLSLPAEIHLGPEPALARFHNVQLARLGSIASLQLTRPPLSRLEILEKRVLDLVVASFALVLLTPLLLAVALLIKLDSRGPVFFLQQRFGFNQKPFRIFKFRTMSTLDDGDVVLQATRDDARITRVGRWLRRFNIDEIPQLFNVLQGEMSLVGPRPHALSHDREYERKISSYARRHNVKPGITGWAQINGWRGQTDSDAKMERRVEHDLWYIDHWSFALDLRILVATVVSRASYRNAF